MKIDGTRRQDRAIEFVACAENKVAVHGDPIALRRVIANLIDNARGHGSRCSVSLRLVDNMVAIAVEDDGPGIPEAEREAVFEPFYRLEKSRNRSTGGSGLGLAIARQIAEAHGGSLQLANRTGAIGCRASLRMPVQTFAESRDVQATA